MIYTVGTFVLVLGIVYGLYWFFVEREDSEERQALKKRLKRPRPPSKFGNAHTERKSGGYLPADLLRFSPCQS